MMKIEAGKFYRTQNGSKVGPLRATWNDIWPFSVEDKKYQNGCIYWEPSGKVACYGVRSEDASDKYAIVAEWEDAK